MLDAATKTFVENHQASYFIQLMSSYNATAIIVNSIFVAIERYENLPHFKGLSTARNVPEGYRLPIEVDYVYGQKELVEAYKTKASEKIIADYIVSTVAYLEAFLEDLYEGLLRFTDPNLTQEEIEKKLGLAMWANDTFRKYILPFLSSTPKMQANGWGPEDWMDSLDEIRIVRHTLIHTQGKFSKKNITKLQNISLRGARKDMTILNTHYIKADELQLDITFIYMLRKWAYEFTAYICGSLLKC